MIWGDEGGWGRACKQNVFQRKAKNVSSGALLKSVLIVNFYKILQLT